MPSRLLALLLLAVTLGAAGSLAGQRPAPAGATMAAPIDTLAPAAPLSAPVLMDSDTLFMLYGHLGPFGPVERATAVNSRLIHWRAELARGTDTIHVAAIDERHQLSIGDQVLMTVLDADTLPGMSRAATATEFARRIQVASASAVQAVSVKAITIDALYALATTVVLVLILVLMRLIFRRLYAAFHPTRVQPLRLQRFELLSAHQLAGGIKALVRAVRVLLTLALCYFYISLVLSFFPWTVSLSRQIIGYVVTPLEAVGASILAYLPNIFFILVIVVVTRYLLKMIHLVFRAIGSGAIAWDGFNREWADTTYNIVRFLVIAFAGVVLWPKLPGSGSAAFKGASIFVGVLFSLGSTSAIGNIVAGVVLTYTQAFRVGDRVTIGETTGDVMEKTLLITRVRTIKNVAITIPNGTVLSTQVINYTSLAQTDGLILHTTVTIGYDAPWAQVHQLLIDAALATGNILAEPKPFVLQTSLDDFYVSYQINAYTNNAAEMAVTYSDLHRQIQDQFNASGVEIMSPHYASLRDGNQVTTPSDQLPKGYVAPAFVVESRPGRGTSA